MTTPSASRLFQHALLDELSDISRRRRDPNSSTTPQELATALQARTTGRPEEARYRVHLLDRIFNELQPLTTDPEIDQVRLEALRELLKKCADSSEKEHHSLVEGLVELEPSEIKTFLVASWESAPSIWDLEKWLRDRLRSKFGSEMASGLKVYSDSSNSRIAEYHANLRTEVMQKARTEASESVKRMKDAEQAAYAAEKAAEAAERYAANHRSNEAAQRSAAACTAAAKLAVNAAAAAAELAKKLNDEAAKLTGTAFDLFDVLSASNLVWLRGHLECSSKDDVVAFLAEMIAVIAQGRLDEWFSFWRLTQKQVREHALSQNLVGLALSGGGIRSATFGLGAIQAMAQLGMLPRFDYLSSVSGGGYISSWLAAWIQREGKTPSKGPEGALANVALQLDPNRRVQARADRDGVPPNEARDSEPFPIYHLRAYSNYLTPLLGIFSADGWAILSTYLRNFFLNQSVFLLLLLACWCGIAAMARLFSAAGELPDVVKALKAANAYCPIVGTDPDAWLRICRLAGLVMTFYFLYVAGNGISKLLPPARQQNDKPGKPEPARGSYKPWHLALGGPALAIVSWYLQSWWAVTPEEQPYRLWEFAMEVCAIWAVMCWHTALGEFFARRENKANLRTSSKLVPPQWSRFLFSIAFLVVAVWIVVLLKLAAPLWPLQGIGIEAACAGVLCFAMIALVDLVRFRFQRPTTTDIHEDSAASREFLWYHVLIPLATAMVIAALTVTLLATQYKLEKADASPLWAWVGLIVVCAAINGRFFLDAWKVRSDGSLRGWSGPLALLSVAPVSFEACIVAHTGWVPESIGWRFAHLLVFLVLVVFHSLMLYVCRARRRWECWYYALGLALVVWILLVISRCVDRAGSWSAPLVLLWALGQLWVVGRGCDFQNTGGPRERACGFVAGAFGGSALYWAMWVFFEKLIRIYDSPASVAGAATFCVPILMLIFVLTGYVQVAVLREKLSGLVREWWASLSGWILTLAGLWLAIVGLAIFGTWLLIPEWTTGAGLKIASGIAWAFTTISGLYVSHGPKTNGEPGTKSIMDRIREALAYIAPIVFIVGLGLIVCVLVLWLLFAIFEADFNHETYWLAFHLHEFLPQKAWLSLLLEPLVFLLAGGFLLAAVYGLGPIPGIGQGVDVNLFSLHGMYTNRLVRCYLGASRQPKSGFSSPVDPVPSNSAPPRRQPNALTEFDERDDVPLADFIPDAPGGAYTGPVLILNTALNWASGTELAWQERKAESFVFTARWCGSTTTHYRPTDEFGDGITLGTAVGISGAAVSPNMGYHSTAGVTLLLTLFNARLGAWLGNPKRATWRDPSPKQGVATLLKEALGRTSADDEYIYLSDGGHFDNLGIYELVRRRCRFIIAYDASADPGFTFDDLSMTIRKVRVDFGVRIMIDVEPLRPQGPKRLSSRHIAIGKIYYRDVDAPVDAPSERENTFRWKPVDIQEGVLVYIKPSLTGDEPPDIQNYRDGSPDFPHESTIDQFFSESQFESYRALGYHCFSEAFRPATQPSDSPAFFASLFEHWCSIPAEFTGVFTTANTGYLAIQGELGKNPHLFRFQKELADPGIDFHWPRTPEEEQAERAVVAQMLTLIENTYFGLKLDLYLDHPVNHGWRTTFQRWANTPTFEHFYDGLIKEFSKPIWLFMNRLNTNLRYPS